ncbi:MAG TPA: DUF3343 domain-containing protein [Bacillota bacterium]|jgi:hypothetical protein|nr:DUF3343 domain-containing protein [Bacillota bacterium]HPZ59831.1 DUF3343 domain-containing protein [Bacillota bacterium]HQC82739.1 DUF3343 domain-containing protein [Bacillota bacterium]
MNEYVIVISSSFFTAAYARDKLLQAGIPTTLMRTPAQLFGSCGHGITLVTNEDGIENIKEVLRQNQIGWRAIFRLEKERGILRYKAI